jgi:cell wall-associated NlpC family hydrolase
MKYATLTCLSVIVLCISTFGRSREVIWVPDWDQAMNRDTLINPDKASVSLRDSIVSFGMKLLGTPYVEGACSKDGFDCSGFVYFVYQHFKIQVPRSTSQYRNFGKEIPIDSIRKGDILLFLSPTRNVIGHVGIVSNPKGKESDFIHASSGSEMKVIISSLKQERYNRRYVKALEVLGGKNVQ